MKVPKEEIIKTLNAIGVVCDLCQLRVTNNSYVYHTVDETPAKEETQCCMCLGILQSSMLTSIAKNIAEKLQVSNYDSPTFRLTISVPGCIMLRDAAIKAYLTKQLQIKPTFYPGVKKVVKFFLSKLIEKISGKQLGDNKVPIMLDFKYALNTAEISYLDTLWRKSEGVMEWMELPSDLHKVISTLPDKCVENIILPLQQACECDISINHESIYIGGRLCKYLASLRIYDLASELSGGTKLEGASVAGLIGEPIREFVRGKDIIFHSSCKGDSDIRILGSGWRFVIEVLDPKKIVITGEEFAQLEAEINASTDISVHNLQFVDKASFLFPKGKSNLKTYKAKLWCPEEISEDKVNFINSMKPFKIEQKIPVRLLPLLSRNRVKVQQIGKLELKRTDNDHYELYVHAQRGTYIQELVHGDLGRTEPSLRSILGVPIDVVELDLIPFDDINWPSE